MRPPVTGHPPRDNRLPDFMYVYYCTDFRLVFTGSYYSNSNVASLSCPIVSIQCCSVTADSGQNIYDDDDAISNSCKRQHHRGSASSHTHELGNLSHKRRRRGTEVTQRRLATLCQEYMSKERTMAQFLVAVAHHIRFK